LSESDDGKRLQQLASLELQVVDSNGASVRRSTEPLRHLVQRLVRRRIAERDDANPSVAETVRGHGHDHSETSRQFAVADNSA
jgi:hypothetical protein